MTPEQLAALDAKLASQIGDDVSVIFNHEALFKESRRALAHLQSEVARLSTPPDDAETAELVDALATKSAMINMGEKIAWGSETALMDKAADAITRLSRALASETAKREADTDLLFDAYKGLLVLFRVLDKAGLTAGADTTNALANAIVAKHPEFPARTALRATLAKHGSK